MNEMLLIILGSTLLPAVGAGYVLRTNGKTINFAVVGATVLYVFSVVLIFGLIYGAKVFKMQATDLILILPFAVAGLFYWMLKGTKMGNE